MAIIASCTRGAYWTCVELISFRFKLNSSGSSTAPSVTVGTADAYREKSEATRVASTTENTNLIILLLERRVRWILSSCKQQIDLFERRYNCFYCSRCALCFLHSSIRKRKSLSLQSNETETPIATWTHVPHTEWTSYPWCRVLSLITRKIKLTYCLHFLQCIHHFIFQMFSFSRPINVSSAHVFAIITSRESNKHVAVIERQECLCHSKVLQNKRERFYNEWGYVNRYIMNSSLLPIT